VVSASCARRVLVRRFEWRRFGLGMCFPFEKAEAISNPRSGGYEPAARNLVLQLLFDIFQRRPAWVIKRFGAIALFQIQVFTAMRAQTFAIVPANSFQRQS